MTFLSDFSEWYLQYIFRKKVLQQGSKFKTVIEVGQQRLKLVSINTRPLKQYTSMYIFEVGKDKKEDEMYMPIIIEYTVSVKDGVADDSGLRMANFVKMAFATPLDFSSNDTNNIFAQLLKHKGKYFNAVIKHKVKLIFKDSKPLYDDDPMVIKHFGKYVFQDLHSAYVSKVRPEDKPFHSIDIDYYTLIDNYDKKDQEVIDRILNI